jgi:amino acid adenylation domain-containing protein
MSTDAGMLDDDTLPALFERAAAAYPKQPALRSRDAEFSYEQLDIAANRVAHALIGRSLAPGDRIAILMQHDLPQIIALLGILKTGRVVVALNPTHPAARLSQLLDDAEAALVITDSANEQLGRDLAGAVCKMVRYEELATHELTTTPPNAVRGAQGAALVYTSGSTGRPKAVVQTHRQLCRNAGIHTEAMHYSVGDRLPLFGSVSGGQGLTMIFCALRNGAVLCPFPVAVKGVTGLAEWMADLGITVYSSSASIFRNFVKTIDSNYKFTGVRAVRLSSEPSTSDDFRIFQRHFPADCIFVHTLSTSETCNIAWSRRTIRDSVPEGRLPIGMPSRGQEVMLLDAAGDPAAAGQIGEIAVKSRYVAAGYGRNDALTAERFSPPFDDIGTRLVRTGDLGRINADGLLEFVGRADDRVKIRGNRIELPEIENAIHAIAGIRRAVVESVASDRTEPLLVAFVTQEPGRPWSPAALRRVLREKLPDHMVPSKFVPIDVFPFTPTGKIDRDALRKTDLSVQKADIADAPHTDMERFLAGLWRESFDLEEIDRQDNFFDLGGDSLAAAVMAARVHSAFGIEIELATFFDFPTLAELAQEIENHGPVAAAPSAERSGTRPTEFPTTYSQESFWALGESHAPSLTMSRRSRIAGRLDIAVLTRCISEIVERHEMLRTTFAVTKGDLRQVVHPPAEVPVPFHDLSGKPDPEIKARQIWKMEQATSFDLRKFPLARFAVIRLRDDEHWLVYSAHAVLLDGLSWNLFFKELGERYDAHTQGTDARRLRSAAPQCGDYAVWQRDTFRPEGRRHRELLAWWMNEVLTASYPDRPGYRRALLWCMKVVGADKRTLKQIIGFILRSAFAAPRPPRSELPFKRPAPVNDVDPGEGMIRWGLSPDVSIRLDSLSRQQRTSDYVIRLAAYIAALALETGDPNVAVYLTLSNRAQPLTRDVFGFCATSAILQLRYDPNESFRQFLSRVRDRLRTMQQHADLPYDRVHREMRAWRIKMPQGRAILSSTWAHPTIRRGDIEIVCLPDRTMTAAPLQFDTKFDAEDEAGNCSVLFDATRYDPEKVQGFIERFKTLLDVVSRSPDARIADAFAPAGPSTPA